MINMLHKAIKGYEDYLVSDDGRVYSLKRGKYLKLRRYNEYDYVVLYRNGKPKDFRVHRLVAEAFIPNPENKSTVDHINRKKTDNRLENLRWADRYEQNMNRDMAKYKHTQQTKQGIPIVEKVNDELSIGYLSLSSVPNMNRQSIVQHTKRNQSHFYCKGREFFTEPKE